MRNLVGLVFVLAACGDDGVHHLADAPPSRDAAVDGTPQPDAPVQPVTLTISQNAAPVAGAKVYFQAPDSTEISSIVTDANGVATAMMPHGGFVTAVDPFPPPVVAVLAASHVVKTFANVKPGDHLVLTDNSGAVQPATQTVTVTVPEDTGATPAHYDVYTSCGDNFGEIDIPAAGSAVALAPPTLSMPLYNCGATTDFLVISEDTNYLPINYFVAPAVAIVDQGTVDLSASTYTGTTSTTFNVSGVPSQLTYLEYDLDFVTAAGRFNTSYYDTYAVPDLSAGTGAASAAIILPPIPTSLMTEKLHFDSTAGSTQDLYRWGATPAGDGSFSYDLTNVALLDFAAYPVFDQPTNTATWTTMPGATPDLYNFAIDNARTIPDGSGGGTTYHISWSIAGAFTGASLTLPTLPGDAADLNSIANDAITVTTAQVAKLPGGYDAIRARVFDVQGSGFDGSGFVTGASGHVEIATAGQPGKRGTGNAVRRRVALHRRAKRP